MTSPESGRSRHSHAIPPPPRTAERSAPPAAGIDAGPPTSTRQRARVLRELLRIRREAEAARLEAQASRLDASAEQLESLLERIDAGEAITPVQLREFGIDGVAAIDGAHSMVPSPGSSPVSSSPESSSREGNAPASRHSHAATPTDSTPPQSTGDVVRFQSWEAIRDVQSQSGDTRHIRRDGGHEGVGPPHARWRTDDEVTGREVTGREDADEISAAASLSASEDRDRESLMPSAPAPRAVIPSTIGDLGSDAVDTAGTSQPEDAELSPSGSPAAPAWPVAASPTPSPSLVLEEQDAAPRPHRRSRAVVISASLHLALLLCLAGFTLTAVMPKDQIALAASALESSEEAIQTFQIETAQPESVTSEAAADETAVELDPLGEMAVVEVHADAIGAISPPTRPSFSQGTAALSAAMKTRRSDSTSKMEFCGVEGGGNHFVYLVDSSGSMGDAFVSARRALLDSIDMLTPEQRFYVIFFDAQCDYMRITRADQDESRSVHATDANKQRLRSWAMRVEMDIGKAPYEPLHYALQKLKPDVIFLLSDGEFPQRIEDLLQTENKVTNLFGETKPISIIHTISYHSREGESRMRRIAENNFGQYRHVPKP